MGWGLYGALGYGNMGANGNQTVKQDDADILSRIRVRYMMPPSPCLGRRQEV